MGDKDTIGKEEVFFAGICDLKDVYNYAYDWLKGEDYTVIEEKYKEMVKGESKDLEIKWKANKKFDDFYKIHLEIAWKVLALTDVEVDIDGKKKKLNKMAELTIKTKATLEQDYGGKWGKNSFQRFLKETYVRYITPERKEQMEDKTREAMVNFSEEMKAFLQLTARNK